MIEKGAAMASRWRQMEVVVSWIECKLQSVMMERFLYLSNGIAAPSRMGVILVYWVVGVGCRPVGTV